MNRRDIETRQLRALNRLIADVANGNPFYGPRLERAGLAGGADSLARFRAAMPFTTKAELVEDQSRHRPWGTCLTYPLERYTRYSQTSGTTGEPLRWLDTQESWSAMVDCWVTVLRESGVTSSDRIFFAFSFGPFLGFWTAFEAGVRLGCLCLPGGGMSNAARARAIVDNGATVLCCTPTYAIRLGEAAAEEGVRLAGCAVRRVIVAGEPGGGIPATRRRIEELWPGALVKDHHGMTEIGPVTFECPARSGVLHVIEEAYLPEVVDPASGEPVPPGSRGELVLTSLLRVGSPLLRYRTGDLVEPARQEVCACGRADLALEGGILGRTDDMLVVRGVNVHPAAVEAIVRGFTDVAEYRATVDLRRTLPELSLEVEPTAACADPQALAHAVESALRAAMNLRIPVAAVPRGALPRFELKARRWVRVSPREDGRG